jgi:hypothetical protein
MPGPAPRPGSPVVRNSGQGIQEQRSVGGIGQQFPEQPIRKFVGPHVIEPRRRQPFAQPQECLLHGLLLVPGRGRRSSCKTGRRRLELTRLPRSPAWFKMAALAQRR